MAQTKRKRQTKHRGNAAGVVEARGRTGRKPTAAEKGGKAGDAARANFILARVAIMQRDVAAAQHDFEETIRLSKDPRMLAWSHIYLGRIYDIQDQRDQAVAEYRAALTVRDGESDTRLAAEKGLKQPYAVPQQEHTGPAEDDDSAPDTPPKAGAQPSQGTPQ